MSAITSSIQYYTRVLASAIRKIKGIWNGEEEVKLSLFTDSMITENLMDSTKKLLESLMGFAVARYKINIQKSVIFLYISNKQSETEIF